MSKNNKTIETKNLGELLKDPSIKTDVEVPASMFDPNKMTLKNLYMMQAFGVMFTKVLNDHGNASIMMRKHQLAISEIENILQLCSIVGDCFESLNDPAHTQEDE
jgi:hypothetical protein